MLPPFRGDRVRIAWWGCLALCDGSVLGRNARTALLIHHLGSCTVVGASDVPLVLISRCFARFRAFFVSCPPLEGDFSH